MIGDIDHAMRLNYHPFPKKQGKRGGRQGYHIPAHMNMHYLKYPAVPPHPQQHRRCENANKLFEWNKLTCLRQSNRNVPNPRRNRVIPSCSARNNYFMATSLNLRTKLNATLTGPPPAPSGVTSVTMWRILIWPRPMAPVSASQPERPESSRTSRRPLLGLRSKRHAICWP